MGASESHADWIKYPGNPVLELGASGEWDDGHVKYPMVIKTGSLYEMWYTGGHVGPYSGNNKIGYANSTDGIHWNKYDGNPVVGTGSGWDSYYVYGSSVIKDGETYKMWYSGYAGGVVAEIGYATSPDGIQWTKHGSPVLPRGSYGKWDSRYVENPTVIKDGLIYKMWYVGNDGSGGLIGYASSLDGIQWTKYPNPVLQGSACRPKVIKDDSVYRMYYRGNHAIYGNYRACYATSTDGINWEIYSDNPILELGEPGTWDDYGTDHAMVIKDGTTYEMWYAGYEENPSYSHNRIGYATMTSESNPLPPIPIPTSVIGSISISSIPSGASIYLNSAYKGTAPLIINDVTPGRYTIKLTKTGYVNITKTVNVVSGAPTSVSETLALIPPSTVSEVQTLSPTYDENISYENNKTILPIILLFIILMLIFIIKRRNKKYRDLRRKLYFIYQTKILAYAIASLITFTLAAIGILLSPDWLIIASLSVVIALLTTIMVSDSR